jgi:hypothetical protein
MANGEADDNTEAHLNAKRTVTEKSPYNVILIILLGHYHLIADFFLSYGYPDSQRFSH